MRLHRFADSDDDAKPDTPVNKLPSFAQMNELAVADTAVKDRLLKERYDTAAEDFKDIPADPENWASKLAVSQDGIAKSRQHPHYLENDPGAERPARHDAFATRTLGRRCGTAGQSAD